ncbi:MAG: hypothetical protein JW808_02335 [Victivallales bacterium]|nr:hypothetical protein [Victivallales bacterium]
MAPQHEIGIQVFYLKKSKKVFGPFDLGKLQDMVASGMIMPEHQISEDRVTWVDAGRIKELFPDISPPPLPEGKPSGGIEVKPPSGGRLGLKRDVHPGPADVFGHLAEEIQAEPSGISTEHPATERADTPLFVSIFWNPVRAFPEICANLRKSALVAYGLALWVISTVLAVVAALMYGARLEVFSLKTLCFLLGGIPFLPMACSIMLLALFFGPRPRSRVFPEIVFLSGACLFPVAISAFVSAAFRPMGILSQTQCLVLLSGLGVYAMSFAAIMIFNSCTRIFGINGQGTVFVVSTVLLVFAGSAALSLRFCLG